MKKISVAIDGPSGAGKSTVARAVAKKMNISYVDTGAMYRAIALYFLNKEIEFLELDKIRDSLNDIKIKLEYIDGVQNIFLNGKNVSEDIRTPEVSIATSNFASIKVIRDFLLAVQRDMAESQGVIMDGRDIGTVVLPNADVKVFLTASPEVRAKRRHAELLQKGLDVSFEEVLSDINERDYNDMNREVAPLTKSPDSILLDCSLLTLDESIQKLYSIIASKLSERGENLNA